MESTSVSMGQIQQMLAGSQRLNQMKGEIDAVIRMAFGFLTEAEVSRFRYSEVICEFATPGLKWKITKRKREAVGVDAYTSGSDQQAVYGFTSGNKLATPEAGINFVQLVHQALPEVLTNLVRVFPSLAGRFVPLQRAASDVERARIAVAVATIRTRVAEVRVRHDSPGLEDIFKLCDTLFEDLNR